MLGHSQNKGSMILRDSSPIGGCETSVKARDELNIHRTQGGGDGCVPWCTGCSFQLKPWKSGTKTLKFTGSEHTPTL